MVPLVVCVEGLIGAGKSTLLEALPHQPENLKVLKEPVEQFQQTPSGHNLLEMLYRDMKRNTFIVQTYMNHILSNQWTKQLATCKPTDVLVSERCLYSPCVFSLNFRDMGCLNAPQYDFLEKQVEKSIDALGMKTYGADKLFFLDVLPEVCFQRIITRGRKEEKSQCELSYLIGLYKRMWDFVEDFIRVKGSSNVNIVTTTDPNALTQELLHFCL